MEHGEDGGGDIDLDAIGRQLGGQPAPAFHIGQDLADALVDRDIQRRQGLARDHAVVLQAVAPLGPLDRLGQGGVIDLVAGGRDAGILGREAGSQFEHARAHGAGGQGRAGRDRLPAALGRDLAIVLQPLPEAFVAGVGGRQAVQPGLQLVLLHRPDEIRAGIVGLRLQPPVVHEGGVGKPARMHVARIVERAGDQLGLAALADLGIGRGQERVQPRRQEAAGIEALAVGLGQGLLEQTDLLGVQCDGGGRSGTIGQHLAERRLAAGGDQQAGAHDRGAGCGCDDAQSCPQRHCPLARAWPRRWVPTADRRVNPTGPGAGPWSRLNPQSGNALRPDCAPSTTADWSPPLLYHGLRL